MSNQDNQVPTQATSGQTADTTEETPRLNMPDYMQHGAPIADPGEALRNPHAAELNRLNSFLMTRFPAETKLQNRQKPETPVDTAIRLLSGLGTQGTGIKRCGEEYCNLPESHDGDHGYVQFDQR